MAEYVHPEVLVSTEWVAAHLNDPSVRIVESDEDILLYETGHVPGAIKVDWQNELQHQVVRDYVNQQAFGDLIGSKGISNNHTVVFYGDKNNWWACYALWVFKMYGHADCRVMNGGRQKWIDEGRELSTERPAYAAETYTAAAPNLGIRAFRDEVTAHMKAVRGHDRRPLTGRVQRRTHPHGGLSAGGRPARRPHPRRRQHPVGTGRGRRRHLQARR